MYVKSIRPSAKREVQKERSAKRAARDENVPVKRADSFQYDYEHKENYIFTHFICLQE